MKPCPLPLTERTKDDLLIRIYFFKTRHPILISAYDIARALQMSVSTADEEDRDQRSSSNVDLYPVQCNEISRNCKTKIDYDTLSQLSYPSLKHRRAKKLFRANA